MTNFESFRSRIESYSGKEFIENLEKTCDELHNVLNILTFGMLVYDETNPEFRKILRDKDYWDALEKASGDNEGMGSSLLLTHVVNQSRFKGA